MSDRLNTTTKKRHNLDSVFNVSPFQSRGFGVQAKSEESAPVSKAELWENYQQAKQLNQGTNRSSIPIQAKLTIGQPGDKYEQEADSVADRVMAMPEPILAKSTVTNSVQTRSIQPIQKVSTESPENTAEESKQEGAEDQIQAKEATGQTPEISKTSAQIAEIPNEPKIQRDSPINLPPIPNYQLTTPSLLQPPDPSSHHKIGGDMSLQLDPQFQLTIQHVQEQVNITTILTAISQIDLAVPVTYNPAPDHSQLLALPPKPGSKPTQSPDSEVTKSEHVDTPDSPGAADASAKPRAGSVGDLLAAGSKAFEQPITFLKTQVKDRLPRDFSKLQAGDIVVGIVTVVPIGAGLLKGLLPNPAARQFALEQLNGKVLPVPGLSWLHLEMNTGKNNLMVGLHVDVGDLLPSSWGFKASSPDAIDGVPEPEPFSLRRKSDSIEDAPSSSSLEDRLNGSKGSGNPLSDEVRGFMEPRFGADFSGVRVHTGSDAVQMNQDVNAQAFAHGSDVYFGAGKAPGKDALTAHELTHVVQQSGIIGNFSKLDRSIARQTDANISIQRAVTIDNIQLTTFAELANWYNLHILLLSSQKTEMLNDNVPAPVSIDMAIDEGRKNMNNCLVKGGSEVGSTETIAAQVWLDYKYIKANNEAEGEKARVAANRMRTKAQEEAAYQVELDEVVLPKLRDAQRAAFRASNDNALLGTADTIATVIDTSLVTKDAILTITEGIDELTHLANFAKGYKGIYPSVNAKVSTVINCIEKANKMYAGLQLVRAGLDLIRSNKTPSGGTKAGVKAMSTIIGAGGTLLNASSSMTFYANLYIGPMVEACLEQIGKIENSISMGKNRQWIAMGDFNAVNWSIEPGGRPVFDFMFAVMKASSSAQIPNPVPKIVSSYFVDNESDFNAGVGGKNNMPTSGVLFWETVDPQKISNWIFLHRNDLWGMLYGDAKLP